MNKIIEGNYKGWKVVATINGPVIAAGLKQIKINSETVESYEVLGEDQYTKTGNVAKRGIIGGLFLGPLGMLLGGATSGKRKTEVIGITFKDGTKSTIQCDGKVAASIKSRFY